VRDVIFGLSTKMWSAVLLTWVDFTQLLDKALSLLCWSLQVAFEAQKLPESSPESIADAVYQHAMKQRSRDDVCVIVLCISPEREP
jgi:hypothetical protein